MVEVGDLKYARDFALLAEELHRDGSEQPTLERIVFRAVQTIDGCDFCGVTVLAADGGVSTPASTDPIVDAADALQYRIGEGPGLDALSTSDTCSVDDIASESRWPGWTSGAAELGIGSVLSVRIEAPAGGSMAALNLYATTPRAFDHTDVAIASILARHAGTALHGARSQAQLRTALHSRQVIGVAQGILIQRFGLNLDQSFEVLRRYSQEHNTKLRTLAENLVRAGGIPINDDSLDDTLTQSFGLDRSSDQPDPAPAVAAQSGQTQSRQTQSGQTRSAQPQAR